MTEAENFQWLRDLLRKLNEAFPPPSSQHNVALLWEGTDLQLVVWVGESRFYAKVQDDSTVDGLIQEIKDYANDPHL